MKLLYVNVADIWKERDMTLSWEVSWWRNPSNNESWEVSRGRSSKEVAVMVMEQGPKEEYRGSEYNG